MKRVERDPFTGYPEDLDTRLHGQAPPLEQITNPVPIELPKNYAGFKGSLRKLFQHNHQSVEQKAPTENLGRHLLRKLAVLAFNDQIATRLMDRPQKPLEKSDEDTLVLRKIKQPIDETTVTLPTLSQSNLQTRLPKQGEIRQLGTTQAQDALNAITQEQPIVKPDDTQYIPRHASDQTASPPAHHRPSHQQ